MLRALGRQPLGDFEAINRVHPVKVLGHQSGFVALHRANAMPHQAQTLQRLDLGHRFLDVIFAKGGLAGCGGLSHGVGIKRLGHGQQLDVGGSPARIGTCRCHTRVHTL